MAAASKARVRVILNPRAAAGAAHGRLGEIETVLRKYELAHELVLTRGPGHAPELAHAARADGVDVIAVVGGDGTLNEVIQAYVGPNGEAVGGPDLALIPCGTGGDFKRTLGMSGAIDEAVARIRHGSRRSVDLGILRFTALEGGDRVRGFVNIASFGLSGAVVSVVNEGPKWFGGRAAFFVGTLRAMASYKNASLRIRLDGAPWFEGPAATIAVANGKFFGGGMKIAPHADPSDGRFEIVVLGDLDRAHLLGMTATIYRGAHLADAGVKVGQAVRVEAEPIHPWASVLIDADGEQPGKLPLKATLEKGALTFRV
jgi:YegS/Rv2252/BmrU family lipid kinase